MNRYIAWFSCGASSAVAAKVAIERWGKEVIVAYCDTSKSEHPDNIRFMADVENWLGVKVTKIQSEKFTSIQDVFVSTRYMAGPGGARCTIEMKKLPRFNYQLPDDIHIFGFTAEETKRISRFQKNNPDLHLAPVLLENGLTKMACFQMLVDAGIKLPVMYALGYKNNNCIGCVKASSAAYWNKVRQNFPTIFAERAKLSREIGCRLAWMKGKRVFLDELPEGYFGNHKMENISCGPDCAGKSRLVLQ